MPYIERVDELAEELADLIGIYGAHTEGTQCPDGLRIWTEYPLTRHRARPLAGMCRVCFVSVMSIRIRCAVENEKKLDGTR